ncbi:uncharacterized protein LOC141664099 isoform X2 [Apium graveolens]|uniref:uncharacterized protein LOC141664099 isoform X2 n=1 Tax=Apium graveolens TaxID=4045 RepID=UPI003D7B1784
MGKRSQRRRLRSRKDQGGCMGGLISIFDFRHARITRNLLLDKKHANKHPDAGEYPATKPEMLASSDEEWLTTKDFEENGLEKSGTQKTSVKELMEESMSGENTLKINTGSSDVKLDQLNSEHGGHAKGKPKKVKTHRSKSCDIECIKDWGAAENLSDQVLDQETLNNLDMGIILEEFCRLNKKGSYLKKDSQDAVSVKSDQVRSLAEEKLAAAIKVFTSQRFGNDNHLTKDRKTYYSKELMDALQTLSVNKELLFELLQDPNSLLVKHIQSMEDEQFDKDQNTSSLSNQIAEEPCNLMPSDKHRRIFRRRSKSQDSNFLKDYDKSQSSSRIVILKPGPTASRNFGTDRTINTSLQSTDDRSHRERNHYQFSLNEIKRKLKHALGKDRHGLSLNDTFPHQISNLRNNDQKGVSEGHGGWSSPNRDHFYNERFAKSPLRTRRVDKIGNLKESQTPIENKKIENTNQGVSSIYFEAKKHLLEMLSDGDEKEELVERQLPKSLGRILSLPEYSLTPIGSPGKDRERSIVIPQMKSSPGNNYHLVNEDMWRVIQENHLIQLSSPKQNLDKPSLIADDEADEKQKFPESNLDGPHDTDRDNVAQEPTSNMKEKTCCEEPPESLRSTNPDVQECIQISAVSCESSNSLSDSEFQSCDAAKVYDDEKYPTSDLSKENGYLSSPPRSPSSPSVTGKVRSPSTCTDREERPSPISVLEPLFSEDDISPSNTKLKPGVQPLQIYYEEWISSDLDHTICTRTCMNDEESAFEYVEAVLLGSDLNWDEYLLRWLSSDQVLDPSLFDDVELFSSRSSHDQKLLFDCTNDVLKELCDRYFAHSCVKENVRIIPRGMKLINEVWQGVERHINPPPAPHSLDQLVRTDMAKPGTWMDLRVETENIVTELEDFILEELVEDMILSLDNKNMKNV